MKWTLLKASEEFGVSRETIRRGLAMYGIEVKTGKTYTTREIHAAIAGDVKVATARDRMASAIERERKNRIAEGELITVEENKAWQAKVLLTISQAFDALPGSMGHKCNPTDPRFAEDALQRWVNERRPIIRDGIEKAWDTE